MPVLMETIKPFGPRSTPVEVDVLGVNPLVAAVIAGYPPNPYSGPAPTLFHSGDRPPFLVSGESPELLRRVRFELRHSAAMTPSRAALFAMIEASTETGGGDPESLMTADGRAAFIDYRSRTYHWATQGPTDPLTKYEAADYDRLFGTQT